VDAPLQDDVFNRDLVEASMLDGLSGPGGTGMDLLVGIVGHACGANRLKAIACRTDGLHPLQFYRLRYGMYAEEAGNDERDEVANVPHDTR
jgi:hypothetical protein